MKKYTIGEIFRLKLLKNWKGEPYKDKATVSRLVNKMNFEIIDTPWGKAKAVTEKELAKFTK